MSIHPTPILSEEIFGPVAPLVRFGDEAEAITMANETEHGLASYVYTVGPEPRVARRRSTGGGDGRGQPGSHLRPRRTISVASSNRGSAGRAGTKDCHEFLETKYVAASW